MHRTQVYLPKKDYERLLELSRSRKTSMADLIRRAVVRLLEDGSLDPLRILEITSGCLAGRKGSSGALVRSLRSEWSSRSHGGPRPR